MSERTARRWLRASQAACAGAGLLLLGSATRAVVGASAPVQGTSVAMAMPAPSTPPDSVPTADIARAIARNPFSADRTPGAPFETNTGAPALPSTPIMDVRLVGTVVSDGARSFVLGQEGMLPARIVYPGQRIGALTLQSVQAGSATFINTGGARVVLRVAKGGN